MIRLKDIEALRDQLKVGDMIKVTKAVIHTDKLTPVYKKTLRRIRRKHKHLVELEGPGYDTVTYVDILLGRMEETYVR